MVIKKIAKKILPPIIAELFRKKPQFGYFGNYKTWNESLKNSSGYDSPLILEKVKKSLLAVKNGEAEYERDSVLFASKQYSWPVLAAFLWISSQKSNTLKVLDFGGSLGSSYFQNIDFLKHLNISWNIVEQKNFVECGKQLFENNELKFYETIEECMRYSKPYVFFASSSLPYTEKPYELISNVVKNNFDYILIDRTLFLPNDERICIQKVRPGIYNASYPVWILNENKMLKILTDSYKKIAEFSSIPNEILIDGTKCLGKGFLFKKF